MKTIGKQQNAHDHSFPELWIRLGYLSVWIKHFFNLGNSFRQILAKQLFVQNFLGLMSSTRLLHLLVYTLNYRACRKYNSSVIEPLGGQSWRVREQRYLLVLIGLQPSCLRFKDQTPRSFRFLLWASALYLGFYQFSVVMAIEKAKRSWQDLLWQGIWS